MGIRAGIEVKLGLLPPSLQIAAPKTEPVLALAAPAPRRRHPHESAEPDDRGDVDELSAGQPETRIFSDPD